MILPSDHYETGCADGTVISGHVVGTGAGARRTTAGEVAWRAPRAAVLNAAHGRGTADTALTEGSSLTGGAGDIQIAADADSARGCTRPRIARVGQDVEGAAGGT